MELGDRLYFYAYKAYSHGSGQDRLRLGGALPSPGQVLKIKLQGA